MFLKTIYDVYFQRHRAGLISDPWPPIKKSAIKMVLSSVFKTEKDVDDEKEDDIQTKEPMSSLNLNNIL